MMKMILWKRFICCAATVALAVGLAVGLTGCRPLAGSDGPNADDEGAALLLPTGNSGREGAVKLRIMWWGSLDRHEATLKALDVYERNHSGVTFEPEYSGIDGYLDKLSVQAAAKNLPDLIQLDPGWVAEWAASGQLADLAADVDLTDVDAKLARIAGKDGKQYAVPLGSVAYGMIYDKSVLDKLGVAAPADGWTWDDFFAKAEEIKGRLGSGQYAVKDYAGDYFAYSAYQYAQGKGRLVGDDGRFEVDRETFLAWAHIWERLRGEGVVPPADVNASDKELDPSGDLMVKGTIQMRLSFSNNFGGWDSMKPGAYALVTMPRGAQAGGWLKPSMYFGVSSSSRHTGEAAAFLDWFVNSKEAGRLLGTTRGVPVSSAVAEAVEPGFSDADRIGMELYRATLPDGQQWSPGPPGWTNWVDRDWALVRDQLSFGKKTPEQAFEELKREAEEYGG